MKEFRNEKGEISTYIILIVLIIVLSVVFVIKKNSVQSAENKKAEEYELQSSSVQNSIGSDTKATSSNEKGSSTSNDQYANFNSYFETYKDEQTGSKVKSLLATVISQNSINKGIDQSKVVDVKTVGIKDVNETANDVNNLSKIKVAIDESKNYLVQLDYNSDGYVSTITITVK